MKTEHFDCYCHSANHTVRFTLDDDPGFPELWLEVQLCKTKGFGGRLWAAIKYVLGYECKFGHWDCWTLKPSDTARLYALLDEYHKLHQKPLDIFPKL